MKHIKTACIALLLCLASGCGQPGHQDSVQPVNAAASAVTIRDFADRQITFPDVPDKIAVLSGGELDIVYALGGTAVGRPTASGPLSVKEAADVEQIGTSHGIDLEKIALLSPDVVLGHHPLNTKDIPSVESIGAKMVLTSANSVDDIKRQIELIGQLLRKEEKAAERVKAIDDKLQEMSGRQRTAKPRVLLVYGAPGTYMAALNNSLSGNILTLAGGENIAADYPKLEQYPQYAQLNVERIIQSNPQYIMLMSHGNPETVKEGFMKEMEQNPAWNRLDAVINGRIEVLPSDLFGTNPGTRVIEALELIDNRLQSAQ